MGWFRLYFLSDQGDIRNVDEFPADDDHVALIIADCLYDAVTDIYGGYELWHASRRVFRCANRFGLRPFVPKYVITTKLQAEILRREKILLKSATAFATSRRLLESIRELQQSVGPRGKGSGSVTRRLA